MNREEALLELNQRLDVLATLEVNETTKEQVDNLLAECSLVCAGWMKDKSMEGAAFYDVLLKRADEEPGWVERAYYLTYLFTLLRDFLR